MSKIYVPDIWNFYPHASEIPLKPLISMHYQDVQITFVFNNRMLERIREYAKKYNTTKIKAYCIIEEPPIEYLINNMKFTVEDAFDIYYKFEYKNAYDERWINMKKDINFIEEQTNKKNKIYIIQIYIKNKCHVKNTIEELNDYEE